MSLNNQMKHIFKNNMINQVIGNNCTIDFEISQGKL